MASLTVQGPCPTINEIVVVARESGKPERLMSQITVDDVIVACKDREVPLKAGRIPGDQIGNVVMGVLRVIAARLTEDPPDRGDVQFWEKGTGPYFERSTW